MQKPPFFSSVAQSLLMLGVLTLMLAGCRKDEEEMIPEHCDDIEWTYEGAFGPEHWGELCLDNRSCNGRRQSPVNLAGATDDAGLGPILASYDETATAIENKGHTIQFDVDGGSFITIGGLNYDLAQFHVHAASEHTLNGSHHAMEIHLVHRNAATGNLAVIGVFVEEGMENDLLAGFIDHLPTAVGGKYTSADTYNPDGLLPGSESYFTYPGSLTTPPCSEIVTWIVFEEPITASAEQIEAIEKLFEENFRPVQPLNGRVLKRFPG